MRYKALILIAALVIFIGVWQLWPEQKTAPTDQLTDIVSTTSGELRGFVQGGLNVYLGIPYAEPPTGSHRFKAPQPLPKWSGVFTAFTMGQSAHKCLTRLSWSPRKKYTRKIA